MNEIISIFLLNTFPYLAEESTLKEHTLDEEEMYFTEKKKKQSTLNWQQLSQ